MKKFAFFIVSCLLMTGCTIPPKDASPEPKAKAEVPADASVATFAGGCFWCIESAFEGVEGVYEAVSGYAGGSEDDAKYELVATGQTTHKEAVQVHYDSKKVSYEDLIDVFWRQIDPTDSGGQFADRGPQYQTAIFYHDEVQRQAAEAAKKALTDAKKFEKPIVTEVLPLYNFFPAEERHQDYAKKQTTRYELYKYGSGRGGYIKDTWGE